MGRKISDVAFELDSVYNAYTDQLLTSSSVADILIENVDIKASGNQIEAGLRSILSSLLPEKTLVSHGHIVDTKANVSRQQDVIIAEKLNTKSIFQTLDGTEFFMIESVFAIGEVKKTLSRDIFEEVIFSIKDFKDRMIRKEISPNTFATSPDIIKGNTNLTSYPFRNPMFSFLFSIDFSKNVSIDTFRTELSNKENWKYLPNVIVILNKGIFLVMDTIKATIKLYPEFEMTSDNCKWIFIPFNSGQRGRSLAYLIFLIQQHLQDALLERPSFLNYASIMLTLNLRSIVSF